MNHEDRILLEKSIVAELLTDPNAFIKVADFLSEKNFSEPIYAGIYKACESLYPNTAIEPFSIAEKTGYSALMLLMEATHEILQHKNIQYRALLLVEHSIRAHFIALIKLLHKDKAPGTDEAIDLSEIITYSIQEETDIFKSIANTLLFFESKKEVYELEYFAVSEFNEKIVKKCEQVRSSNRVKTLYLNLENLYQFDYRKKDLLQALSNLTRHVMAFDVSPSVANQILTLSTL